MNSFLTWIGGKKALRKKIVEQFPEKGTFNRYVEVFGGAGWVLFFSEGHAKIEIYNDINGNLVNLFRCVKYHPTAVQEELEYILTSREQFYDAREQIKVRGMTDIQRAAQFFILIKESFGADIRSFGLRARDMNKAKEYLNAVSNRLNKVVIENDDFRKIIKNYDKKDTLFYLDPPYYDAEKYYPDRFMPEDHLELKRLLEGIKGKFILSYNSCGYIRKLYGDYNIVEVERAHSLIHRNTKPRYQELIIKNY
jgi:DNA adenine methylase